LIHERFSIGRGRKRAENGLLNSLIKSFEKKNSFVFLSIPSFEKNPHFLSFKQEQLGKEENNARYYKLFRKCD